MVIEIKTTVARKGNNGIEWVTIVITESDLIELAKSKALEGVDKQEFDKADCDLIEGVQVRN